MAVFKCKMCGGDLEIQEGMDICECMYCGTKQTLPKLNDERRANLYDRANHFRRNNEFDKAMSMYEQILEEDKEDAEAYWSLVLCTYGIEYVEDPATHKRMPTVNRTQFTSVFADENYKAALQYANSVQRQLYEEEAKQIDEIQKGILDISNQEEPYDVFICYKETDQSGKRTPDSVLANDLYHQLTQEGLKVFFARITLEDKLGSAYEPYIFAALNSAKVMVVIGTRAEYFNAVWVKNEWSRYLGLIKNGAKKVLIPAYKDMDPYDMPQEFSHLQSQDMSKLGFMQDLLRGIKKLTDTDKPVQPAVGGANDAGTASLLKRAFLFLEDGDFARADEFCEKVLNIDPESGEAYLGKLMAEQRINQREKLAESPIRLDQMDYFSKIMRFGSEALKAEVNGYNQKIIERQEQEAEKQRQIEEQKAERQRQIEEQKAERQRQIKAEEDEKTYQNAVSMIQRAKKSSELRRAIYLLNKLSSYKDTAAHIKTAEEKLEKVIIAEKAQKKKLAAAAVVAVVIIAVLGISAHKKSVHKRAVELIKNGSYESAYDLFGKITDDTAECDAIWAEEMLNVVSAHIGSKKYEAAAEALEYAESHMTEEAKEEVSELMAEVSFLTQLSTAEKGDKVTFGRYKKYNFSKRVEELEWYVWEIENDEYLLFSADVLGYDISGDCSSDCSWENSEVRNWMNTTFYEAAFYPAEQKYILSKTLSNDHAVAEEIEGAPLQWEWSIKDAERDTVDKVFSLSVSEILRTQTVGWSSSQYGSRFFAPSTKVREGVQYPYWLRTVEGNKGYLVSVDRDGFMNISYRLGESISAYVRPAIWVSINPAEE